VTRSAEFAPITELNWAIMPQANTVVDVLTEGSISLSDDTPPLADVDQQTRPSPAKGRITDFRVKGWRL
jgi:hypothetical protein